MWARPRVAVLVTVLGAVLATGGLAACSVRPAPDVAPQVSVAQASSDAVPTGTPGPEPDFPVRAAFYYQWFPEGWEQEGVAPYTRFTPSSGRYDSADPATIRRHVAGLRWAGIQAVLVSWWGPQEKSEQQRLPALLSGAMTADPQLRIGLYYEREGSSDPSVRELRADLAYIASRYGGSPNYLRVGGRPVVFVYSADDTSCAVVDRWRAADPGHRFHVVLKVFRGYAECAAQPDGWHQYEPAQPTSSVAGGPTVDGSFAISPGFWHARPPGSGVADPFLARDLARWRRGIRAMVASGARWQLVTSFNEWGEGTAVESAAEWASASGWGSYLDALHDNGR
jgi:hypothetical protein